MPDGGNAPRARHESESASRSRPPTTDRGGLLQLPTRIMVAVAVFAALLAGGWWLHHRGSGGHHLTSALMIGAAVLGVLVLAAAPLEPVGSTQRLSLVLLSLASLVGAGALYAMRIRNWGVILALVPAALIARQAVFLRLVRRRDFFDGGRDQPAAGARRPASTRSLDEERALLTQKLAIARRMGDRDFQPDVIAVRFGVPAFLVLLVGFCAFQLLKTPGLYRLPPTAIVGARFGAAGAYTYVLIYLGQRAFRQDITNGAAMWSAVMLALGPVIGGVLSMLWRPTQGDSAWAYQTVYFVAGSSPRFAASLIDEAARRLALSGKAAGPAPARLLPLGQVRGIGREIEERLGEEGIGDAYALAMCDPFKLHRNTSFDKRQILSWIDEALLMTMVPDRYADLQRLGVSGVIDLAAYGPRAERWEPEAKTGEPPASGDVELSALAEKAELEPSLFRSLVLRLREDGQVQLIWALYQLDDELEEDGVG